MTLVVKLGSSIVAADDGDLRTDVLDSVCEQVAALVEQVSRTDPETVARVRAAMENK